jgi:hypothetical protein
MNKSVRSGCCVFLSVLFLCTAAGAAEYAAGGRVGLNLSAIFGDSIPGRTMGFGLNASVFFSAWLTERFGVQPELFLSTKGERWSVDDYGNWDHYATKLTYLEVPVLAKLKIVKSETLVPVFFLGPDLGLLLGASSEIKGSTLDQKPVTKSVDFGVTAGTSLEIRRNNSIIPIDIRYTLGLINYSKDAAYKVKNGVFSVSAGLGFLLNVKKEKEF